MTDERPPEKKRAPRVYVMWGAALALLLTLTLFCWFFLRPYLMIRTMTAEYSAYAQQLNSPRAPDIPYIQGELRRFAEPRIARLGGAERAAGRLALYLKLPPSWAPERPAAAALCYFCGPPGVPVLARALTDEDPEVRIVAAAALGAMGPQAERAIPELTAALKDSDSSVRWLAAQALGRIGPAARPAIPAILEEARYDSVVPSAEALGNIGFADEGVVLFLTDCLENRFRPAAVKKTAAVALGKLGPAAAPAASELTALLATSQDAATRRAAVEALKSIAPSDGDAWVQLCEEVLNAKNDEALRLSAAQALVRIGRVDTEPREHQIEMLEDALKMTSGPTRQAAAEALKKIKAAQDRK